MSIERGPQGPESAWDVEAVSLSSTDYSPTDGAGKPVIGRGILITGAGALVIVTPGGNTVTFASGALALQVIHPIHFTKIVKSGTGATGIYAFS